MFDPKLYENELNRGVHYLALDLQHIVPDNV